MLQLDGETALSFSAAAAGLLLYARFNPRRNTQTLLMLPLALLGRGTILCDFRVSHCHLRSMVGDHRGLGLLDQLGPVLLAHAQEVAHKPRKDTWS